MLAGSEPHEVQPIAERLIHCPTSASVTRSPYGRKLRDNQTSRPYSRGPDNHSSL
jgi:hypothetical protein